MKRNFERHNFISFVFSFFSFVSVEHHFTGSVWDCGPDSHQQRFILVPRDNSFLNSGVQPQLFNTYHTHTCTHTRLLHSILESVFFFFFVDGDKLLGPELRSVSGVRRFRLFPTLDRQSMACAPQLHWQGWWKQTYLESTQNKSNIEGWRREEIPKGINLTSADFKISVKACS